MSLFDLQSSQVSIHHSALHLQVVSCAAELTIQVTGIAVAKCEFIFRRQVVCLNPLPRTAAFPSCSGVDPV